MAKRMTGKVTRQKDSVESGVVHACNRLKIVEHLNQNVQTLTIDF
jgi:hypothetical protein